MKVSIDDVVADIEAALVENSVEVDEKEWVIEAWLLSQVATKEDFDRRCDSHDGVPFMVEPEYAPQCMGCERKGLWLFAKGHDETYELYFQCPVCKEEGEVPVPFRVCGRERVITTLAIYFAEKERGLVS